MMAPRYTYGGESLSMGRPPSIADDMARRQQFEDVQYMNALQQQNAARAQMQRQYDEELALEREVKRNRLGLGGLEPMLTDRYSDAYQTVYPSGEMDEAGNPVMKTPAQMGHPAVQMSISPDKNTAPAPLGLSPLRPIPYGQGQRQIKPEFQDDLAALGTRSGRTRTVEEMEAIERAKADERIRIAQEQATLNQQRDSANNQSRAVLTAGRIQADNFADPATVANDMQTSVANVYRGQSPVVQPSELSVQVGTQLSANPTLPEFAAWVRSTKKPNATDEEIRAAFIAAGGNA